MSHYSFGVRETLALDVSLGGGVNASTTFGGTAPPPLKFGRAKNEFERKYLWNR